MAAMAAMGLSHAATAVSVSASCTGRSISRGLGVPVGIGGPLSRRGMRGSLVQPIAANVERKAWRRVSAQAPETAKAQKGESLSTGEESEIWEEEVQEDTGGFFEKAFLAAAVALVPLVDAENAFAAGGEFGLLEGRTLALIHPLVMGGLLVFTLRTGFLGWQWRRVRTIQNEINELKKQVKPVAVSAGEKSGPPPPPSPVEANISSLTDERKELLKGGYKDRHHNAGSILLGTGVTIAILGAVNTWFRTGKLFPGPHLFAGAGIVICWAIAAALVPAMQKGNETARNTHIGLNVLNVLLFIWQVPTGWEIVEKVFQFTTWP